MRRALHRMGLVAEIFVTYLRVRALLRTVTLPSVVRRVRGGRRARAAEPDVPHLTRATVRVLGRLPVDDRCLTRTLVLLDLLARRGLDAEVVLSAGVGGQELDAHAWLERGGRPLLPPAPVGHRVLLRL